ncbi:MAG: DNA alkylation repair protein [Bacilli bacterium]|jgi:3-methyladenine DNA glycosylase AlkD|nr:DNA alkylation repair protein [Bacilli bacterium]MDD3422523.1 DNA alkylation repair protein [Bacilli bacterium]MDD4066150.1 DNA alkylation repair protein [Bacilli bacterium]
MELKQEHWTKELGQEFQKYLLTLARSQDKRDWEQRVINTNYPCLAILSKDVSRIIKEIKKGNFREFLDLKLRDYHVNIIINGVLITYIPDFKTMVKYLDDYLTSVDNWATVDTLNFKIKPNNEKAYYQLAQRYLKSKAPFTRRMGLSILLQFVKDPAYLDDIYAVLDGLSEEKEYYVNMMGAWLLCEAFVKHRDETLAYFKRNKTNSFICNKGISKCHDSFRVSKEDKELLKSFRK